MAYIGLAVLIGFCALSAAVFGGRREWGGVAIVAAASALLWLAPADRGGPEAMLFLSADLVLVGLLGGMGWKAPRPWPVWVLAALAVGAAASLAFLLQPDVDAQTYDRALVLTRYAAAAALLIGSRKRNASHP